MADAWDQFQDASNSQNRTGAEGSAHDDAWSQFKDAPQKGGLAQNFMAGVNTAVADTIGAPVDLTNWALHHNPVGMALNAASRALGYGDIDKSEAEIEAQQPKRPVGGSETIKSAMGYIGANPDDVQANTTGERLARSAGTGAAMVAAPEFAAREAPTLLASSVRGIRGAATGAASGVGSEAAQEVAPAPLKPLAALIGGVGGGVGPEALLAGAKAGARSVGIMSAADAERAAANRIAESATDVGSVRNSLANVPEIVPGSNPTTFQATQDPGLGGLSLQMQKRYPAQFAQREAEQNAARVGQLNSVQPGGDPSDLGDYLRHTMRDLDDAHHQAVASATERAQTSAEQIGGRGGAEDYGAALRSHAQDAADIAKASERSLWRAVDPDGNLTVNATPIRETVSDVFGRSGPSARPLSSDERAIKDVVANYGQAVPFRDVGDLRSWVSEAMRQELRTGGNTQTYARLARVRGAIENAITSTAEAKASDLAQTHGQQASADWADSIRNSLRDWQTARGNAQANLGAVDAIGAGGVSSTSRTQSTFGGRPDNSQGDQGIPATAFDAEAVGRLKAANQATRNRADTYNRGPVGQILRKDGRQDQYRVPTSAVAAKIFHPGPTAFEHVQAYRQAVGDPNAMVALQDYAASSLRRSALRTDGMLDPTRVNSWLKSHSEALRAFPDLRSRFQNASAASSAVTDAMAARRAAVDAYETGSLGKVMRARNPDDVTRTVSSILNSSTRTQQMKELASATARNADARAGLRKAVADTIQQRFVSASDGEIKAKQFVKFMQDNSATLRTVFNDREVGAMKSIAADLLRTSAVSPVAPASGKSLLKRLLSEGVGSALGAMSSLHSPFAGWVGAKALGAIRDAGMTRVDDVVRDAMLNPDLAYALLKKGPPGSALADELARVLKRASVASTSLAALGTPKPKPEAVPSMPVQPTLATRAERRPMANALMRGPRSQNAFVTP